MQVQFYLARDTLEREVTIDDVWHIRIQRGMHRYRFVIARVLSLPEKNRSAGC
jgi:hypothetical protein